MEFQTPNPHQTTKPAQSDVHGEGLFSDQSQWDSIGADLGAPVSIWEHHLVSPARIRRPHEPAQHRSTPTPPEFTKREPAAAGLSGSSVDHEPERLSQDMHQGKKNNWLRDLVIQLVCYLVLACFQKPHQTARQAQSVIQLVWS